MQQPSLFASPQPAVTLSEFAARIARKINAEPDLQRQWVIAETSDVRVVRGHCYMELVEKDARGVMLSKVGAVAWASVFTSLNAKFAAATGSGLKTGMKVLVLVSANYHSQYGFKVIINDIDPSYTMGDMERQRQEILNRLKAEGIIDRNKQLPWPQVPQRIAIVSAAGAAGYGDFINQLYNNPYGLQFYTCLFAATMQGAQTVPTVLATLDSIHARIRLFDCVVIIRGGGATSELNSFDNYDLASAIARFPIPVIVGIGHERDRTVLDDVAAMRVKTPTAAAEWLVQQGTAALARLDELQESIAAAVRDAVAHAREHLAYFSTMIPATAQRIIDTNRLRIEGHARNIPIIATGLITAQHIRLDHAVERIGDTITRVMQREQQRLQALSDKAALLSPQNTLSRGYALVRVGEKCVTSARQLRPGDNIAIQFATGTATATIDNQ